MPQTPPRLNSSEAITETDNTMTQVLRTWTTRVADGLPIVATGSPEGVIEAPQYTLYIDEAVPLSPVQYRKMLPFINDDRSKGWVEV